MAQIMEKSRQNYAFVLSLGEGDCGVPKQLLVVLNQIVHLLVAQVGGAEAVLEPVVDSSRENHVVWTKLVDGLEPLDGLFVDEAPGVVRQRQLPIDDIVHGHIFE